MIMLPSSYSPFKSQVDNYFVAKNFLLSQDKINVLELWYMV